VPPSFRGEDFFSANQKQELPVVIMFLSNQHEMMKSCRGPFIDASCTNSLYFAKRFQMRILLEIDQPEIRIAYGGHVC
jgi:hypothetical protein